VDPIFVLVIVATIIAVVAVEIKTTNGKKDE